MLVGAQAGEQRHRARLAEAQAGGGWAIVGGWQHHALERRGVWRALARLELVVEEPLVDVVADLDQRLPVLLGESPADTEVAGVVDGRFGSERAALFEVLLDLGRAIVHLDRRRDALVEDLGVKPAGGLA